jgi:predicted amidohydrolase
MPERLRVALTQLSPTTDVASNVASAAELVREAGPAADLVLLPENCLAIGSNAQMRDAALPVDSAEIAALQAAAADTGAAVVVGGFKRRTNQPLLGNTALVIDGDGTISGGYDKVHLFDAVVGGKTFRASEVEAPGDHPVLLRIGEATLGLTICFDVRFPALYRRLAEEGAQVLLVPAAFATRTGQAHWEVLLRARAIETGSYVVASATIGGDDPAFPTYGHAMAVDPWGRVLADLGEAERAWEVVELDLDLVQQVRASLPVLTAGRPEAYAARVETIDVATSRHHVRQTSATKEVRSA